jgi:hypothetical protein
MPDDLTEMPTNSSQINGSFFVLTGRIEKFKFRSIKE